MITEDYVSFETAKLLKEKGFDEDIDLWYDEKGEMFFRLKYSIRNDWRVIAKQRVYLCPTLQMAIKWLREVHHIHIGVNPISGKGYNATIYDVADFDDYGIITDTKPFLRAEQACEDAIKYCLKNLI